MPQKTCVNELTIKFANVNGSGSASANHLVVKSIFRMGLPVAPRNLFPSNIQGLPTWYEIRVSESGYLGCHGKGVHIMLSVNPQSMPDDVQEVLPGGYFIYDNTKMIDSQLLREDISYIGIPMTAMTNSHFSDYEQRRLFKNVTYVGALSALLNIDFELVCQLVSEQFKRKQQLIEANIEALKLGREYALEHFQCPLPYHLEARDLIGDRILIDGNRATALGAIYGGATVAAWYPITPSTSVIEAFEFYAKQLRKDEQEKNKFVVIQAEDEIAALGMAIGAGWNGGRAFTATSGPGLSLMNEFLGLAYFAEIPLVLIDVQRVGPSTGMPTRTQQGDVLYAAYAGHGDTKHILLFPSNPKECFELTAQAFDIADRLQTPVIILSDLDLGMNESVSEPLEWDDAVNYDRGKLASAELLEQGFQFSRYLDVDGDAISYRSIPATHPDKGAYMTRGSSRDEHAVYTEKSSDYQRNMERLLRKFATALAYIPEPVINLRGDKPYNFGVIHYGSSCQAVDEALDIVAKKGYIVSDLRLKGFPFSEAVSHFINQHDKVIVIEQNRDSQMRTLLVAELQLNIDKLIPLTHYDGSPINTEAISSNLLKWLQLQQQARIA